jgi:hypothetical protein
MKHYEKRYEDYYDLEYAGKWCDINDISAEGLDLGIYRKMIREVLQKSEIDYFDAIVKFHWLRNKFRYKGKRRVLNKSNGVRMDAAFGLFLRWYTDYSGQVLLSNHIHREIEKYLKDFFPDLDERDPFKEDLKFPFRFMSFEDMVLVANMDERMDLLAYGEVHELSHTSFVNYVLNYISCLNEESGKTVYMFMPRHVRTGNLQIIAKNKYL